MKSFKRICTALIIMMLSIAMVLGTTGISAFALSAGGAAEEFLSGAQLVRRVKYGTKFTVPAGASGTAVKVTGPSGKVVASAAGEVAAMQVGTYVVSYSKGDYTYDMTVDSYLDQEFEVVVKDGGADIPTYFKSGAELTFPAAKLVYKDDKGKEVEAAADIKVYTSMSATPVAADGTGKVTPSAGNLYVTYSACYGGENGTKYFTKDFLVKVQDEFEDKTAPTVSVVNVPQNASLNKKMTLPAATASDNYDANVKILVTVKHNGVAVKKVKVDADDFATEAESTDEVFDNTKEMSFYPVDTGKYEAIYQAIDDSGNKSAEHTYPITVSDTSAPIFKDIEDWKIPANWGLSVNAGSSAITFPTPTIVDNDKAKEKLTVEFKLTNPDGNTVISYSNILATNGAEGSTFVGKAAQYGVDGTKYPFGPFDFALIKDAKVGDYTVEYIARDAQRNRSSRTFKINIVESYEDDDEPNACKIEDAPEYLVLSEETETFTVPAIEATDAGDSRAHVEYTLSCNSKTLKVGGGEVLKLELKEGKFYLVSDTNGELEVTAGATLTANLKVTDNCNKSKEDTATIKLFGASSSNTDMTLDVSGLTLSGANFKTGSEISLGKFEIGVGSNDDFRKFTGYELSIKNAADKEYATKVTSEYYYDTVAHKIVVRDIKFVPSVEGTYQISVRAFDLSGRSIVKVGLFSVTKGAGSSTSTTAAKLSTSGDVRVNYSFKNEKFDVQLGAGDDANTKFFAVYKIEGSKHAVMGTEFTAMTAGSYRIDEGYAKYDSTNNTLGTLTKVDHTDVTFTDAETPVIEVQGVLPAYSAKSVENKEVTVTIPAIVARTKIASVPLKKRTATDSDVVVRLASGGSVTVDYNEADGTFSFKPVKDGQYRIIMTGTVGSKTATKEHTMNVGDVVGPKVKVDAPESNKVVGDTFKFAKVTATADSGEDVTKFTFTKRLLDPSGTEVTEATITGTGNSYAEKEENDKDNPVKFSKSGDYTVEYEVTDENGNVTVCKFTIAVSSKTGATTISIAAISTVLIVVGVVLIVAVILYFVLFRKRKVTA